MNERPVVAIVMPAYNAAAYLPRSLAAALRAAAGRQVLVVDPASSDGTADLAIALGAEVLRLPERAGPAQARNEGVARVSADVVLFLDSDCEAHPDAVERVEAAFAADEDLVTFTGSYDDRPPDPGFYSQYMNLRHHFVHQGARTEDASFWAGCGAVRRLAFLRAGGFDADRYPRPMIEDIELSLRMRPLGHTRLDPGLQVKHLKRWDLRSVVETDILCRAVPWSRLLLEARELPNDLNLRWSQRIAAALVPISIGSLALLPWAVWRGDPGWALAALAAPAASLFLGRDLLRFFWRVRGPGFALRAWSFHQCHLFYSAVTFAVCVVRHLLGRMRIRLDREEPAP